MFHQTGGRTKQVNDLYWFRDNCAKDQGNINLKQVVYDVFGLSSLNLVRRLVMTSRWSLLMMRLLCQKSRSRRQDAFWRFTNISWFCFPYFNSHSKSYFMYFIFIFTSCVLCMLFLSNEIFLIGKFYKYTTSLVYLDIHYLAKTTYVK